MPVNDFLAFATNPNANVVAQPDYAADPSTENGFTAGIALSAKLNKVWRQASFIGAGLAEFVMDRTQQDVVDDGDLAKFVQQLTDSFVLTLTGTGDVRWVNITGDTMTGPLILSGDPTDPNGAATKNYIDNGFSYIGGIFGAYLPLAGGTLTGPLILNANPTDPFGAATKDYVDQLIGPITGGGALDARYVNVLGDSMQGALDVLPPTMAAHATNKGYVDGQDTAYADYIMNWANGSFAPIAGSGGAYLPLTGGTLEGPGNLITRGWNIIENGLYIRSTAFPGLPNSLVVEGFAGINSLEVNSFTDWGDAYIGGHLHCEQYLASRGLYVTGDLIPGFGYSLMVDGPAYYSNRIDAATLGTSGVHTAAGGVNVIGTFPSSAYGFISDHDSYFRKGVEVVGTISAYGDLYVTGGIGVTRNVAIGAGLWVGGVYPGLNYTVNISGDVYVSGSLYATGNMTAYDLAVATLLTCNSFDVTGSDCTIQGNATIGNILNVAGAIGSPSILASYQLWANSLINTALYQLAGINFAYNGGSYIQICNPSGQASFTLYSSGENYYQNEIHVFVNSIASYAFVQFDFNNTYNRSGVWVQYGSSREYKRNIEPYERGLEALRQITPVSFIYNENMPLGIGDDGGRTRYGLILEDVIEIVPEMAEPLVIQGRQDVSLAPGHLVYLLTNAVKELADKVDTLQGSKKLLNKLSVQFMAMAEKLDALERRSA
jgi:hypothetical protein